MFVCPCSDWNTNSEHTRTHACREDQVCCTEVGFHFSYDCLPGFHIFPTAFKQLQMKTDRTRNTLQFLHIMI